MRAVGHFVVWAVALGLLDSIQLGKARSTSVTQFFLYTRSNQSESEKLFTGDLLSVKQSSFDATNPTKIIIHGFSQSAEETPNPELSSAYLDTGEYNVILVDYEKYSKMIYIIARSKVPEVAADVAAFIDFLNEYAEMSFDSLVVIGLSLGAQVAGFTGKYVTRGRLPYIVGLGPCHPLYDYSNPNERLNSSDAVYVETIQTNGGALGFVEPIGSASFHPNWGRNQPGCGSDEAAICFHTRSVYIYADAIRGYKFSHVYRCASSDDIKDQTGCNTMVSSIDIGDPTQIVRENGIFYFTTTSEEPFGHE